MKHRVDINELLERARHYSYPGDDVFDGLAVLSGPANPDARRTLGEVGISRVFFVAAAGFEPATFRL